MGTLARAAVAENAAGRATQEVVTIRERRADDEDNPDDGVDQAGPTPMAPMKARTTQALSAPPGALKWDVACSWGRLRRYTR